MNRRAFLTSLVATSALAACPAVVEAVLVNAPEVDFKVFFQKWYEEAMGVMMQCYEDQIIYGTYAYERSDLYPYIRRIDPRELILLPIGGLFTPSP